METQEPTPITSVHKTSGPKRLAIFGAIAAVIVFAGGALYIVNHDKLGEGSVDNLAPAEIQISDNAYVPATIRIKEGQQVTWVNKDAEPHHLTTTKSGAEGLNASDPVGPQQTLTVRMEHKGTFTYHEVGGTTNVSGTIIVE